MTHPGEFDVPLEYGIRLYKQGKFEVSMKYFKPSHLMINNEF